jgi:hypothetical protein
MQLLDAIDSNMRKEYTLEGVYQWMTHHIIPMAVLAELVVHSYPYKADIHMTLLVRRGGWRAASSCICGVSEHCSVFFPLRRGAGLMALMLCFTR